MRVMSPTLVRADRGGSTDLLGVPVKDLERPRALREQAGLEPGVRPIGGESAAYARSRAGLVHVLVAVPATSVASRPNVYWPHEHLGALLGVEAPSQQRSLPSGRQHQPYTWRGPGCLGERRRGRQTAPVARRRHARVEATGYR